MSDENENEPAEGTEQPTPVEETGEAKRLVRPTMLPVEGVVYCLDHTEVHDDTTTRTGWATPSARRTSTGRCTTGAARATSTSGWATLPRLDG